MTTRTLKTLSLGLWVTTMLLIVGLCIARQYEAAYYLTYIWQVVGFVALAANGAANGGAGDDATENPDG